MNTTMSVSMSLMASPDDSVIINTSLVCVWLGIEISV